MIDRWHSYLQRYRRAGVLIDANLFMLLLAGLYDRDRISEFSRTNRCVPEDYDLLRLLIDPFAMIVTTPNIVTEVSNLADALDKPFPLQYFEHFIRLIHLASELYTPSREIMQMPEFLQYGLTDAAILQRAIGQFLVLTDDLPLYVHLITSGVDAVNFTQFRAAYLLD